MIPEVHLGLTFSQGRPPEIDPDVLAHASTDTSYDGDETTVDWNLPPEKWHMLPRVRAEVERFPSAFSIHRTYLIDDHDPREASLAYLRVDSIKEARTLPPAPEDEHYCGRCAAMWGTVREQPDVTLELPPPLFVPGIFMTDGSLMKFASEPLIEQFDRQGLMKGLELVPTTLVNPTDYRYFGLVARTKLRLAEPFGSRTPKRPCLHCGAQSPAHAFFDVFEHPAETAHRDLDWFCSHTLGPSAPIVSGRVYRWLRGPGAAYAGQPIRGKALWGARCGWYPEDAKLGYLPERFQKASLEPIEPLRPDEYPLPKADPKRRKSAR